MSSDRQDGIADDEMVGSDQPRAPLFQAVLQTLVGGFVAAAAFSIDQTASIALVGVIAES